MNTFVVLYTGILINDENYVDLISSKYDEWLNGFEEVNDKRLLWDLAKYRIRQTTISYSKQTAKERRNKLSDIENKLKESEKLCTTDPTEKKTSMISKGKRLNMTLCLILLPKETSYAPGLHGMKKEKRIINTF